MRLPGEDGKIFTITGDTNTMASMWNRYFASGNIQPTPTRAYA